MEAVTCFEVETIQSKVVTDELMYMVTKLTDVVTAYKLKLSTMTKVSSSYFYVSVCTK